MLPFYIVVRDAPYNLSDPTCYVTEFSFGERSNRKLVIDDIATGQLEDINSIIYVDVPMGIIRNVTSEIAREILRDRIPDNEEEWTDWESKLSYWANKKIKANGVINV